MALDASIPLGVKPLQLQDPLNAMARIMQVKGMQQEQANNALLMDEKRQGFERSNRMRQILEGGGDAGALRKGGFLKESIDLEKHGADTAKVGAETLAKKAEGVGKKVALYRDQMANINDPQGAAQLLSAMHADPDLQGTPVTAVPLQVQLQGLQGGDFGRWKQEFGLGATEFIKLNKPTITTRNLGGTTDTLASEGVTGKTTTLNRVANTATPGDIMTDTRVRSEGAANRGVTLAGQDKLDARARDANRIAADGNVVKTETDLRKEFADLPEVKRYKAAYPSFNAIQQASKSNNPQADINLVYGVAKLYDPESVVREGEYATIANSQAIPEWLKGMAQRVAGGGRLTPETKRQIMEQAGIRIRGYEGEYQKAVGSYENIAKGRGANTSNVIPSVGRVVDFGSLK